MVFTLVSVFIHPKIKNFLLETLTGNVANLATFKELSFASNCAHYVLTSVVTGASIFFVQFLAFSSPTKVAALIFLRRLVNFQLVFCNFLSNRSAELRLVSDLRALPFTLFLIAALTTLEFFRLSVRNFI